MAPLSDSEFLEQALRRIYRNLLGLAVAGTVAVAAVQGGVWALSFFIGTVGAWLNLKFFEGLVNAIGTDGSRPMRGSTFVLGMKLFTLGTIAFVILKVSAVVLTAVMLGLLVMIPAVLIELLYELIYART